MSRLIAETRADGETAQYRYDVAGNAVWIKDSYGETVNEFDANGNVIAVKDAKTGKLQVRYERDAQGNKTAVYLADGSMIRYDYDELGVYRGYEFVEPGRQPHGTVPGANYKPSPLVPPAEETKNWKKTDALKEADKQIRHAKFAEYTTEVAYVEAEAMAPGSAQAKSAKAAYAQTKKAVDAAYAAKDAVADAKTQTGINRAVTSAQIAAGTAGRTADMVCLWEGSVASAKQAQQAAQAGQGMTAYSPTVEGPEEEASSCRNANDPSWPPMPQPGPPPDYPYWLYDDANDNYDYLSQSIVVFLLGDYSGQDPTVLSIAGGIAAGFFDYDLPLDIRELIYDVTHFDELNHPYRTIFFDTFALLPFIGAIKYIDDIADFSKQADKIADTMDGIGDVARRADDLGDIAKHADDAGDVIKRIKEIYGIDIDDLRWSYTVQKHTDREYQDSILLIQEIIQSTNPVKDPKGTDALFWEIQGFFNGSPGTFELLIDPETNTIWHFLFKGD